MRSAETLKTSLQLGKDSAGITLNCSQLDPEGQSESESNKFRSASPYRRSSLIPTRRPPIKNGYTDRKQPDYQAATECSSKLR